MKGSPFQPFALSAFASAFAPFSLEASRQRPSDPKPALLTPDELDRATALPQLKALADEGVIEMCRIIAEHGREECTRHLGLAASADALDPDLECIEAEPDVFVEQQ